MRSMTAANDTAARGENSARLPTPNKSLRPSAGRSFSLSESRTRFGRIPMQALKRLWTGAALGVVSVFLLLAPSDALGGKKDYEFARGLLARKWYDMADKVFKDLEQNGRNEDEKNKGRLGQIEVLKHLAEDESDAEKKKKLFEEAIRRYKDFLQGSSDINAQFNLAELLKTKGIEFTKLAQEEGVDDKQKKSLQDEAQKAFTEAVDLIAAFVAKMQKIVTKKGSIDDLNAEEKDQLQKGSFYHAELHLEMAKIFEGSAAKKNEILNKAIELFEEFLWDWEEYVSAFHAYIKKGLCYIEMGNYEQAIDSYRAVLGINTEDAGEGMIRVAEALGKKAYYHIIQALNKAEKYDLALRASEEMEGRYSLIIEDEAINFGDGRMAMMEKAKAYAGKGDYSSAIATVMPIVKKRGYYALKAVKLLSEWGSRDPTATVEVLFLQGEGLIQSGDFPRAVEAFEETIDKISSPAELKKFGSRTWHQLGLAYAFQRRYFEAGLSFEEGERVWGGRKPDAGEENWGSACAYRAYSAFKKAFETSGRTDFLKSLYSEKRIELTTKYPDSKYAKNLQFFAAQDKMAEKSFMEAVTLFESVDKISEYFEDAQSRIGRCYFGHYEVLKNRHQEDLKKANLKEYERLRAANDLPVPDNAKKFLSDAEKKLLEYIELTKETKVEGLEQRTRRHKSLAVTLFFLGRVYDEKRDQDKVLKYLEEFETKFKDMPEMVLPASFLRLRAYFDRRDPRGSEDMVRLIESTDNQIRAKTKKKKVHIYTLIGFQLAGKLFSELSNKAKRDAANELADEYSEKAAEYLWKWIQNDPKLLGGGKDVDISQAYHRLDAVGIQLFKAGEFDKAAMVYDTILRKFGDQLAAKQSIDAKIKVGDCYVNMANWEQAKNVFEELNEMKPSLVFIEKLVFIYDHYGDALRKDRKEKEAGGMWDNALGLYGKLLKPPKPDKREWWSWKLAVWEIMFKKGNFKDVVTQITKIKMMYPELGGAKTRKGIEAIFKKAKEKAR
jgi:tetratricopeptide (TPR) repeat protein